MGRPSAIERTSLDRLKALESLPTLGQQLEEAQELCNHSARADMILKWLTEKLKTQDDAKRHPGVWKLLESTLRLLPLDRIATLLGSCNILSITKTASHSGFGDLFLTVADFTNLLLDLSDSANGAALKAVLGVDAAAAAKFAGAWFKHVYERCSNGQSPKHGLLRPAVEVWNLRKPHANENKLFSDECLVSVSSILALFASHEDTASGKRKRGAEDADNGRRSLESLLAKHIFLPARTQFFKPRIQTSRGQPVSKQGSSETHFSADLLQLLSPLRAVRGELYNPLPVLLDIALRCVPTPTLGLRIKEQPWVENLFDCIESLIAFESEEHEKLALTTLISMLSIIGKRAMLSTDALRNIIRTHSNLAMKHGAKTNGSLVTVVIKLDSSVFADHRLFELLCNYVSVASQISRDELEGLASGSEEEAADRSLSPSEIKNGILVPVMGAFARERRLLDFIQIWEKQIQITKDQLTVPVWLDLDDAFQSVMESSLTQQQILDKFDRVYATVQNGPNATGDGYNAVSGWTASIAILKAILKSVTSAELQEVMHERLGLLLKQLLQTIESGDRLESSVAYVTIWALCTIAFELWYPTWATEHANGTAVEAEMGKLFSYAAGHRAACFSDAIDKRENAAPVLIQAARECDIFIACMAHHLSSFQSCGEAVRASLHNYVHRIGDKKSAMAGLQKYPSVVLGFSEWDRKMLLNNVMDDSSYKFVKAVFGTIVASSTRSTAFLVEEMVSAVIARLADAKSQKSTIEGGIAMLHEIPSGVLSKAQSGRIIDTVTQLDHASGEGETVAHLRLSLLIKLLSTTAPSAKISTDSTAFWQLAVSGDAADELHRPAKYEDLESYRLLAELARVVTKQMAVKGSGCSFVIADLTKQMDKYMAKISQKSGTKEASSFLSDNIGLLGLIKGIWEENAFNPPSDLKHVPSDTDTLHLYRQLLVADIKHIRKVASSNATASDNLKRVALLDALVSLEKVILSQPPTSNLPDVKSVLDEAEALLDKSPGGVTDRPLELSVGVLGLEGNLLQDFPAASNGVPTNVTDQVLLLLDQRPNAVEYSRIIATFRDKFILNLHVKDQVEVIAYLLSMPRTAVTPSAALMLARVAISSLDKAVLKDEGVENVSNILYETLQATARNSNNLCICLAACECVLTILKEKPFLTNQFTIETTLVTFKALAENPKVADGVVYLEICKIFTILLQQYRSRLSDRYHLVVPVFQTLLSRFFQPSKPTKLANGAKPLTTIHAQAFARLLQRFCNPPAHVARTKSSSGKRPVTSSLVDEARNAQAQVGQYIQYVLHTYCAQVLTGTMGEGVREALIPGLWAMLEAMDAADGGFVSAREGEGAKVLSTAMGASERAVLRSVVEEWRSFGGRWMGG